MRSFDTNGERGSGGRLVLLAALIVAATTPSLQAGECPSPEQILAELSRLGLERGARTTRFETPPPERLYEKAARSIGQPYTDRNGHRGQGVIVAELSMTSLWKALNDEDRHDAEGAKIPVQHSEVIRGTPRGESRWVFQWAKQMGLGRWWVSRVWMNRKLYESSEGKLWELLWQDEMDQVDPDEPPVDSISSRLSPIKSSRGAWLLAPIGESCTLVEYFNWSEPGGFVGLAQPLIVSRALRSTVSGIVGLAQDYTGEGPEGAAFRRPDGTPLE